MEQQTVIIGRENIVPSGAKVDGISIRRSGIAKVLWRKMDRDVPRSEVIKDGVLVQDSVGGGDIKTTLSKCSVMM